MRQIVIGRMGAITRPPRYRHLAAALMVALLYSRSAAATGATVTVPIVLDYALLRQLLVNQLFTAPEQTRELFSDHNGCNRIVLADPSVSAPGDALEVLAQLHAQLGVSLFSKCFGLIDWEGKVAFQGRPVIHPESATVRLEPLGSWLISPGGKKITSGQVWKYARDPLQSAFSSFRIDFGSYTRALGSFLPEVLPGRSALQSQETLDSLSLGELQLSPENLKVSLNFTVEELAETPPPEAALSPEELEQWETRWQTMDALLVFAVKHYAAATHLDELRYTLLDILIDSRYQLREALAAPADLSNDLVRAWFLRSWKMLSPVVRSISLEQGGQEPLMWMQALAAIDALSALDQLGPTMGLDISVNGLRRLARLINAKGEAEELRYDDALDPVLQQLFQQRFQSQGAKPSAFRLHFSLFPRAFATPLSDKLNSWVPEMYELDEYIQLLSKLLEETADNLLQKSTLKQEHSQLFKNMVLATAWQESCWRQYIVIGNKLEPLRSSTGDIGLMQINERIWRGFYDMQKLRWDIEYNSNAGAEVLLDFMVKYALKRGEHNRVGGLDNLARASYSAYNGGPGQVSRYRRSDVPPFHKQIDTAFWEKYRQVNRGNVRSVAQCLAGVNAAATSPASRQPS